MKIAPSVYMRVPGTGSPQDLRIADCSARLDKVSKYVRDLGQLSGERVIGRYFLRRVQVEQCETRR